MGGTPTAMEPPSHRPMASPPASSGGLPGAAPPQGRAHGAHEQSPVAALRFHEMSWGFNGITSFNQAYKYLGVSDTGYISYISIYESIYLYIYRYIVI